MYATVRKYKPQSAKEVTKVVNGGFLDAIKKAPGFYSYQALEEGNTWLSISIFETKQQAEASNKLAADWVKKNAPQLELGAPEITEGELVITKIGAAV